MSLLADTLEPVAIPLEAEQTRASLRAFLSETLAGRPLDKRARSWSGHDAHFSRELGRRGWLGVTFPTEYGGAGLSNFARFVVIEELLNAGAPVGAHWIADRQSGPLLLKYGTESQKRRYLPAICKGEAFFCIGMSEPGAGSDLSAVRTRARTEGGKWIVSGQKIWTTFAQHCHYMIALVRTRGDVSDRHEGLSQVIIDLSLPGISIRPITDLTGDSHFCEVFFDDVVLEGDAVIGEEGAGWRQVTAELAYERSGPERFYTSIALFDGWLAYRRLSPADAQARQLAGTILSRLSSLRALSLAITAKLQNGETPVVEAALVKDLGTTLEQYIPAAIADDLGRDDSNAPDELVAALNYALLAAPSYSLRGGTREILRGMIARGLGLR